MQQAPDREIEVTEHIHADDGNAVAVFHPAPDGTQGIGFLSSGPGLKHGGARLSSDGELSDHMSGEVHEKKAGELAASLLLVEHLRSVGETWGDPQHWSPADRSQDERGVDTWATDTTARRRQLLIQVTTPETEAQRVIRTGQRFERLADVDTAAAAIRAAVEKKRHAADVRVTLLVDATATPRHFLPAVFTAFRDQHGPEVAGLYGAIWIVGRGGPNGAAERLDVTTSG